MKLVFFDFDGVVLDSVPIKTRAFGELFAEYGATIRQQAVDYHLAHGGISRFEKFRYYFRELLHKPLSEGELERLGLRFTELTMSMLLAAPFISGIEATLAELKTSGIPAVVASGTPQDDLDRILRERELGEYFVEAHGSPQTKVSIVEAVCSRYGVEPKECVFVGDAMTDHDAARNFPMPFLGVSSPDVEFPEGTVVTTEISAGALERAMDVFVVKQ